MPHNKFLQPADAIEITGKSGRGTLLPEERIEEGRRRVAAGEDIDAVASDLAIEELVLTSGPEGGGE